MCGADFSDLQEKEQDEDKQACSKKPAPAGNRKEAERGQE